MRARFVCSLALLAVLLAAPASAQFVPTPLVLEGDVIPGVGTVTRIDNVAINDGGDWLVEADTDNADTNADSVLLKSGALFLREGQALVFPVGSTLDSFDSVILNNNADGGFNFFLDSNLPSNEDSGVFLNDVLVIQEGDVSGALAFTPGTQYIGFFDVKLNDSNVFLIVASVDDPAIPSSVDRALVLAAADGSGNLLTESVLAKEGDILPGQTEPVADFGTGPHQSAVNNGGQVLYFADLSGSTSTDGAIYLDGALLAQEGSPSPLPGRNYEFLSSRGLDLNNVGGHVFKANVDGDTSDDELIVANGAVFRQEGDTIPAIAPFRFTSFGTSSGPVYIDDGGDVLWYGDWDDPDTDRDTGLFLNDTLLVREGVTTIGGLVVDTISSGSDAFELSDDGTKVIFEATLEGGIEGAFRILLSDGGGGENEPPVAVCTDRTVIADETCTADANVDAGSFDPDGDPITLSQSPAGPYPVGDTVVTLTVTDDQGASDSCMATVTVIDVVPPTISVALSPDELWPPNHRLVDVTALVTATDDCSQPAVELVDVVSDEPDNANGDGDTVDDIQGDDPGTADFEFQLRAERSGLGSGRTYTATYLATDSSGNQASASGIAFTPHDKSGKTDPVDLSVDETAAGTMLSWDAVAGASYYNVIRGRVGQLARTAAGYDLGHVICVRAQSTATDTSGDEDTTVPAVGEAFFYLVEYQDGLHSGYGTETAAKPRIVASGDCQ